jgi:hypothetical protein
MLFCGPLPALFALCGDSERCRIFDIGGTFPVLPVAQNSPVKSWHGPVGEGETQSLCESDVALVAAASLHGPIAYLETDYFGGVGMQLAAFWRDGRQVIDLITEGDKQVHEGSPINRVLRELGVVALDGRDEFAVQGLARYRSNDDIFDQGAECAQAR